MPKSTGLGDNFYVAGNDLSNDTSSLGKIGGGPALLDVTGINVSAHERLGGLRNGGIDFNGFFNPTGAHPALAALPTADVICTYARGTVLGNPAACMVAKQVDYNPTRATNGDLTIAVSTQSNAYGLEWGVQLTPGLRTDTALSAPAAPSLSTATSGGTITAGTYQVVITYVNASGETTASSAAAITTTGNSSTITINSPAAAGNATGWYAYLSPVPMQTAPAPPALPPGFLSPAAFGIGLPFGPSAPQAGISYTRQQAAGSPTVIGTNLTLTAPPTSTGAPPPTANTSGQTNGAAVDLTAVSTSFGWQAYLQANALAGTDVTVTLQDSADGVTFANLAGGSFSQVTAAPAAQRLAGGSAATVRRYLRAVTSTVGGFTSATFSVVFVRNTVATTF